ncbi:ABC transporter permease [Saccharopolyspora sp. K220]|uniref:ABC transporter permease n=1 Tax=Saccharopolyspora soli TaxID=2926618 RepID=UPI001F594DDC|nr:ABC transporter permease [Saccharopolyspora soli]MCI2420662.1 ABC transporter permease [Saccharopolyspora soli]
MSGAVLALSRAEAKLLLRNKTVATSATLLPMLMGFFLAHSVPENAGAPVWSTTLSLQLLMVLGFTVYFTVTAALTSRREDLYLKRLRSGEPSESAILTGLLAPVVVLGIVQAVAVLVIAAVLGAPVVANPLLLAVAMLVGTALCVAAGAATSGRTSTAEQAQITTLPWFFVLIGGAMWMSMSAEVTPIMLAVPGGAFADLVRRSMSGEDALGALPALGALLAWTVLLTILSRAWFRWEPRT